MLWYGKRRLKFCKKTIINLKRRNNIKIKSLNFFFKHKINFNVLDFFFHLPAFWNLTLLNTQNGPQTDKISLYFYSPTYYFHFPITKHFFDALFFDKQSRVLYFKSFFRNNFFSTYWTIFKIVFASFSLLFFKKIKFKGKGYYIYRNKRNTIAMQLGYSHIVRIFAYKLELKFNTKTSFLMIGVNKANVSTLSISFKNKKPINIFTGKGIRFSKQIVYKKTGKVSSYR